MSGLRVDAAPFVIELAGTDAVRDQDAHAYLRDLRAFTNRRRGDAILLAEANLPPKDQRRFFGDEDGDEIHMLFDFILNQHRFLAWSARTRRRSWPPCGSGRRFPMPTSGPTSSRTTMS